MVRKWPELKTYIDGLSIQRSVRTWQHRRIIVWRDIIRSFLRRSRSTTLFLLFRIILTLLIVLLMLLEVLGIQIHFQRSGRRLHDVWRTHFILMSRTWQFLSCAGVALTTAGQRTEVTAFGVSVLTSRLLVPFFVFFTALMCGSLSGLRVLTEIHGFWLFELWVRLCVLNLLVLLLDVGRFHLCCCGLLDFLYWLNFLNYLQFTIFLRK